MDQKETFDWMRSELDRLREEVANLEQQLQAQQKEIERLQGLNDYREKHIDEYEAYEIKAEQQIAEQKKDIALGRDERMALRDRNSILEKQVELLSAPVSDEECGLLGIDDNHRWVVEYLDGLLASRAALSKPTEAENPDLKKEKI